MAGSGNGRKRRRTLPTPASLGPAGSEARRTIAPREAGDRAFTAGQDIFRAGDRCSAAYSLVEGWACLYELLPDGRRQILHFALPGAILYFRAPHQELASYSAQALTSAVVRVFTNDELVARSREDPEIGFRLAQLISRDRGFSYSHLTSTGRRTAHERVALLLLELFIRWKSQWPSPPVEEMHLPLTQEHIADAMGLTGVHVNRVLRDLRNDRVLEFHYRRLRIIDFDKLMEIAGVDPRLAGSW